jgi:hypothetical protein
MLGSARSAFVMKRSPILTPIASYGFNEGSGTTTADASGNSHTLTLNTTTWTTGHTGFGLTNTTATLGASTVLTAPTAAITMMAWIKPLNLTSGTTCFALGFLDTGGNTDVGIFAQRADFGTADVLQCDLRTSVLNSLNGPALTLNTWTHITMVYDGTQLVLYKDGGVVASSSLTGAVSPGNDLCVAGWNGGSTPEGTNVTIDDVRVFNVALTQPQIATLMTTPV